MVLPPGDHGETNCRSVDVIKCFVIHVFKSVSTSQKVRTYKSKGQNNYHTHSATVTLKEQAVFNSMQCFISDSNNMNTHAAKRGNRTEEDGLHLEVVESFCGWPILPVCKWA